MPRVVTDDDDEDREARKLSGECANVNSDLAVKDIQSVKRRNPDDEFDEDDLAMIEENTGKPFQVACPAIVSIRKASVT